MEKEGDGNPTTPSLHHGASSASTEGVEAAGTGANAAARPETASKLLHEDSSSTSAGVGEQELEDALAFMSDLKERLDRSEFVEFVKIMEDFSAGRQSTIKCVESAKELLENHPELILGLNALLPDELVAPKAPNYHEALSMVARVKHRFMDNESKYNTFLELISMHRNNQISSNQLWETMKVILVGHQDLLDGFRYFLITF